MPDQIPAQLKKERLKTLENVQAEIRRSLLDDYVNAHEQEPAYVLVEQQNGRVANGHTEHYVEVDIDTDKNLTGQIVPVVLTGHDGVVCRGAVQA